MTSRCIVGFDGTESSRAALKWAITRAERDGLHIVIVTVAEEEAGLMGSDFAEQARDAAAHLLADTVASVHHDHPALEADGRLLEGSAAWDLVALATADDLLVVGTRPVGDIHSTALGSRSVQVAANAICDVFVVPEGDLSDRHGVVAGVRDGDDVAAIVAAAAREAAGSGDDLLVLHCEDAESPADSTAGADAVLQSALDACREIHPSLMVRFRRSGKPAAEALAAESRRVAAVVLGPTSFDPLSSPIGSVTHELLVNASAVVLIARD